MKAYKKFFVISLGILLAAACGGPSAPTGDPVKGEAIFSQSMINDTAPGCTTCHSLEPDKVIVGPSLNGVASRAQTRVEGLSAEEYLRQSILEPNAFISPGFPSNVMYQKFADVLTKEEVDDIVAYLLTLE